MKKYLLVISCLIGLSSNVFCANTDETDIKVGETTPRKPYLQLLVLGHSISTERSNDNLDRLTREAFVLAVTGASRGSFANVQDCLKTSSEAMWDHAENESDEERTIVIATVANRAHYFGKTGALDFLNTLINADGTSNKQHNYFVDMRGLLLDAAYYFEGQASPLDNVYAGVRDNEFFIEDSYRTGELQRAGRFNSDAIKVSDNVTALQKTTVRIDGTGMPKTFVMANFRSLAERSVTLNGRPVNPKILKIGTAGAQAQEAWAVINLLSSNLSGRTSSDPTYQLIAEIAMSFLTTGCFAQTNSEGITEIVSYTIDDQRNWGSTELTMIMNLISLAMLAPVRFDADKYNGYCGNNTLRLEHMHAITKTYRQKRALRPSSWVRTSAPGELDGKLRAAGEAAKQTDAAVPASKDSADAKSS